MKRLHNASLRIDPSLRQKDIVQMPATYYEQDIIDLHNIFLTHGVHYITVVDLKQGRELVQTLLQSLHYYTNVACVTLDHEPLAESVCDVYAEMATQYSPVITNDIVEQYLLDRFYFDFMWIEASEQLLRSSWYASFENKLNTMNKSLLPIIILLVDTTKCNEMKR